MDALADGITIITWLPVQSSFSQTQIPRWPVIVEFLHLPTWTFDSHAIDQVVHLENGGKFVRSVDEEHLMRFKSGNAVFKFVRLKAQANEDTLLRTHCCRHKCFPVCPRAQHLTQKMFLILFKNNLCPQQMFPSLRSMEIKHSFCVPSVCAPKKLHEQQRVRNNVSSFASTFSVEEA